MDVLKLEAPISRLACDDCRDATLRHPVVPLNFHLVDVRGLHNADDPTVSLDVRRMTLQRRADGAYAATLVADLTCPGCKTSHHFSQHLEAPRLLLTGIGRCTRCQGELRLREEQIDFVDSDVTIRVTVRGVLVCERCSQSTSIENAIETGASLRRIAAANQLTIDLQHASLKIEGATRSSVFVSYSHKDRRWVDQLLVYLAPLRRKGLVKTWSDLDVVPGTDWRAAIESAMDDATVAVLLVSPHFLDSEFIHDHELPILLERAESRDLQLLWIAVSASMFAETPVARYAAANDPARPLDTIPRAERGRELVAICEKIKRAVER